jgi:capsular exopolysaccharide synthesis family protein
MAVEVMGHVLHRARGKNGEIDAADEHRAHDTRSAGIDSESPRGSVAVDLLRTAVMPVDDAVLERNRLLGPGQPEEYAQTYSLIRTQILQKLGAKGFNNFAVVSPGAGEGKTLTAINIALSIARSAQYTAMVVDMDLRQPSVHKRFELEPPAGVADVLANGADVHNVLINPGIDSFTLFPAGRPKPGSEEMLASRRASELCYELKNRYTDRILIFDLPPLLSYDDAIAFMPNVDACLLVVEEGKTRRDAVERTLKLLDGKLMLGSVLNRSREKFNHLRRG